MTTADRELIAAVGGNPRRIVPGSVELNGDLVTWTERMKHRGGDHVARSAYVNGDLLDPIEGSDQ